MTEPASILERERSVVTMDMGPFDRCVEHLSENLEVLEELSLELTGLQSGIPDSEIKEEPRHALPGDTSSQPEDE